MTTMLELDADGLHRTAKYFMDSGRAASHAEAMELLERFGLSIHVGPDIASSPAKQVALLSLVNLAHRTLLGGIEVLGVPDCANLTTLNEEPRLRDAVRRLGGRNVEATSQHWPVAVIGAASSPPPSGPAWRATWSGWRGGAAPLAHGIRLSDDEALPLAPMVAVACLMNEVFSLHAADHPLAGRRPLGLSLWRPGRDWALGDYEEPAVAFLPSRLWLIGLGNLGQAFCWSLASLPYGDRSTVEFVLQDFDTIAASNVSTSLLAFPDNVGARKARIAASWLDRIGFRTWIEERRFGASSRRDASEPAVALCGVDNALARAALEDAGFDLVIEAGLGAGPDGFRGLSMHSFPASRTARSTWSGAATARPSVLSMPAYAALASAGMDQCGLATLASRTVAVPFVGLLASTLAVAELLRRLHGADGLELLSVSVDTLDDVAVVPMATSPYAHGHVASAGIGCPKASGLQAPVLGHKDSECPDRGPRSI